MPERTRSLIQFLIHELAVSSHAIALRHCAAELDDRRQYGFINLSELSLKFAWMAENS